MRGKSIKEVKSYSDCARTFGTDNNFDSGYEDAIIDFICLKNQNCKIEQEEYQDRFFKETEKTEEPKKEMRFTISSDLTQDFADILTDIESRAKGAEKIKDICQLCNNTGFRYFDFEYEHHVFCTCNQGKFQELLEKNL